MKVDTDEVRAQANGRWEDILTALAPDLAPAVSAKGRKHVPCPVHGGKDGLRSFKNVAESGGTVCNTCGIHSDGFSTLMWVNGWDFVTTLNKVAAFLGIGAMTSQPRQVRLSPPVSQDTQKDDERLRQTLNRVWTGTIRIADREAEPARLYLARRGLSLMLRDALPGALRFHPSLPYYDGENRVGNFPCLVAMVQDRNGKPVTIHRTFLTNDGHKAPVESPKKVMSYPSDRQLTGSAIQIVGPGPVLAVAEGLETALAVMEGTDYPVWCAINAYLLENLIPPEGVERVLVFADKDRPSPQHPKGHGQEAARHLVQRLWEMGIQATAIVPAGEIPSDQKSLDWLDILNRDGKAGFPSLQTVERVMRRAA